MPYDSRYPLVCPRCENATKRFTVYYSKDLGSWAAQCHNCGLEFKVTARVTQEDNNA